jgi:hypothetical protein
MHTFSNNLGATSKFLLPNKAAPYWGSTNIRRHHTKFSHYGDMELGICAPLSCYNSNCLSRTFSSIQFRSFWQKVFWTLSRWNFNESASNRNEYQEYFLGGKGSRCVGLTTLPPSCADCLEVWKPRPPATLRACPGLYRDSFTFYYTNKTHTHTHIHNAL